MVLVTFADHSRAPVWTIREPQGISIMFPSLRQTHSKNVLHYHSEALRVSITQAYLKKRLGHYIAYLS